PTLPSTEGSADETSLADRSESEQAPPPPPPPVVVAGEHTPLEGPPPTLRILAPRSGQTIRSGSVQVRVQLRNWALESPEGRHVHLILDDEPYIALRDLSRPIDLNAVVQQNLGHELAEGTHVIRMFPSRGHHESVKEAGAFAAVVFHYRRATEGFQFDATQPLLTYSRPKGCNPPDRRLLLDFYVTNATLAPDQYRVRWTLDGHSGEITSWVPHFIENLPEGEHTLQLTLIGPDGNPVSGPFNDTTRRFTVAATCP
ncbi:MAG: hypothetical protein J7448_11870, partial [Thermomicrobium sp.]|nr:hypothetical protein [Thermomicrobium sp.]